MNETLDPLAVAKKPVQQRARERFESILQGAEALLIEVGLSGFSVPVLAERLGFTRGSIYAYFPTPYAILNELVLRYLSGLEEVFLGRAEELQRMNWREAVATVVDHAVSFYEAKPAARLLILGGAVTDDSYRAQEITVKHLGDLGRSMLTLKGFRFPKSGPDVTTLSADIGTACFRRSYFEHGRITPAYREAAVTAMIGFLSPYLEGAKSAAKPARKTAASRQKKA